MPKIGELLLHSVEDIAKKLDTHPETVRLYIRKGRLQAQKFGKKYWVTDENLRRYFEGNGNGSGNGNGNGNGHGEKGSEMSSQENGKAERSFEDKENESENGEKSNENQ